MTNEPSPRPWRVMRFSVEDEPDRIIDANGDEVAIELLEDDAALIVDAVNERERLRDLVRRMADALQGIMDAADGKGEGVLNEALLREARAAIGEDAK